MNGPNRKYTIALLVLGFILIMSAVETWMLRAARITDPSARWVFQFIAFVELFYVAAMAATLALRAFAPAAGTVATTALNIVLLIFFPFGTAIGIYGLLKVDKQTPPEAA